MKTWPTLDDVQRARTGPFPKTKTPIAAKVVRGLKLRKAHAAEDKEKTAVRKRDGYCRFPLCGCAHFILRHEVSHQRHKGAGGNPARDRSTPDKMIYLCVARHQANRIAVDRGTLRWQALTKRGAAGPVAWFVDLRAMGGAPAGTRPKWVEVARETARHVCAPMTDEQRRLLEQLAEMQL